MKSALTEGNEKAEKNFRPSPMAVWVLRACLTVRCLAIGDTFLWNIWERESDLFGMMLFDWRWPEPLAMRIENGAIGLMVLAGALVLIAGWFQQSASIFSCSGSTWRRVEQVALWFVLTFEILFALALTIRGGKYGSDFTFASHALRIAMPVTLLLWTMRRRLSHGLQFSETMLTVLRCSIAITFIAHGWKAWQSAPEYTTLILGGWQNIFGTSMAQQSAKSILKWIGAIDVLCGIFILFTRSRAVLYYLILWGLLSAAGRTIGSGIVHYPETFLRLAHAGGPFALYLEWRASGRARETAIRSEHLDVVTQRDGQ